MISVGNIKQKLREVVVYWNKPLKGRYMPFKEIGAYSFGGIGAYCIITLGTACLLGVGNTLLQSTLGIDPMDMYVMYVIAVLANIPMTGIRANIIDNTRNKAGKYRPYIFTMALPTSLICVTMVWFPYNKLEAAFGSQMLFGESKAYVIKCAIILVLNLLLHFFYYFFYDAYENLIHVLSPDSQERADVSSIKSIVYSLAPTLVNLFTPIIAQNIFHTNSTDIRVYRLLYPILCVFGLVLCMVVYKHTEEKIVQARTHVIQVKFIDAVRAVAKNKYFWIISLAGWIGFLETAYVNILYWLYNYGGSCNGNQYGIIVTIYGNASLWGMILAPFLIRKWGKKAVLVVTNLFNIMFILLMLPATRELTGMTIWLVLGCLYMNAFMGSFALILNPSIQADIRDYQQYVAGERIDGMFSAVATIGTVITLATSSILPKIYEKGGLTKTIAQKVTSDPAILSRMIGDKNVGTILAEQLANGQNNYINANSALYDPDILLNLLHVLILFSALGAALNVIPYFWYDFNETKQKSVVRSLKIRAMFEDYGNGVLKDEDLVETCDILRNAFELENREKAEISRKSYRKIKDKAARKEAKKEYKAQKELNEEIEISRFVAAEVRKFESPLYIDKIKAGRESADAGLDGIKAYTKEQVADELKAAKAMPKGSKQEKEMRSAFVDTARSKVSAYKAYQKYYSGKEGFEEPDFKVLEGFFDKEDECDEKIGRINREISALRKSGKKDEIKTLKKEIESLAKERKEARRNSEKEMNRHARFNRAAKPYLEAVKLLKEKDNYENLEKIYGLYDEAKARLEERRREDETAAV
ncbi:MAG: MFS transporter [Clostridia bacterium]|nr:MFS transporter [Clostridia bacterium]